MAQIVKKELVFRRVRNHHSNQYWVNFELLRQQAVEGWKDQSAKEVVQDAPAWVKGAEAEAAKAAIEPEVDENSLSEEEKARYGLF